LKIDENFCTERIKAEFLLKISQKESSLNLTSKAESIPSANASTIIQKTKNSISWESIS